MLPILIFVKEIVVKRQEGILVVAFNHFKNLQAIICELFTTINQHEASKWQEVAFHKHTIKLAMKMKTYFIF